MKTFFVVVTVLLLVTPLAQSTPVVGELSQESEGVFIDVNNGTFTNSDLLPYLQNSSYAGKRLIITNASEVQISDLTITDRLLEFRASLDIKFTNITWVINPKCDNTLFVKEVDNVVLNSVRITTGEGTCKEEDLISSFQFFNIVNLTIENSSITDMEIRDITFTLFYIHFVQTLNFRNNQFNKILLFSPFYFRFLITDDIGTAEITGNKFTSIIGDKEDFIALLYFFSGFNINSLNASNNSLYDFYLPSLTTRFIVFNANEVSVQNNAVYNGNVSRLTMIYLSSSVEGEKPLNVKNNSLSSIYSIPNISASIVGVQLKLSDAQTIPDVPLFVVNNTMSQIYMNDETQRLFSPQIRGVDVSYFFNESAMDFILSGNSITKIIAPQGDFLGILLSTYALSAPPHTTITMNTIRDIEETEKTTGILTEVGGEMSDNLVLSNPSFDFVGIEYYPRETTGRIFNNTVKSTLNSAVGVWIRQLNNDSRTTITENIIDVGGVSVKISGKGLNTSVSVQDNILNSPRMITLERSSLKVRCSDNTFNGVTTSECYLDEEYIVINNVLISKNNVELMTTTLKLLLGISVILVAYKIRKKRRLQRRRR